MIRWNLQDIAKPERWTARKLSKATGLSYSSVWGIWSGNAKRVDLETLDKLCQVLNVEPGELFVRVSE